MVNEKLLNEIAIQDRISVNYTNIRYQELYSKQFQDFWYNIMIHLIDKNGLILDNGCGVGQLKNYLPQENIIGCDISKGMLNQAKKQLQNLILCDSGLLPFNDETFDIIICRGLLHHLPDPVTGISEMWRVLKPNGELIITEPIDTILSRIPRKLVNSTPHFSELHKDFDSENLINMLNTKFYVSNIEYFGYIAYPILGFPDIVSSFKYIPLKRQIASLLIKIDNYLSKIPLIKKNSWAIIIKAMKNR